MSTSVVYLQGRQNITVPANGSVAVWSQSKFTVNRLLGFPNEPDKLSLLAQLPANSAAQTYGPYTTGAVIVLEADAAMMYYEVGVSPAVQWPLRLSRPQPTPVAVDVTGAISALAMLGGIVTSTTAAAVAGTVPAGTVMDLASQFSADDSFDWSVIATGANAFTVTAATGHTLVGNAVVATTTSGQFRTRKTATATYVTYRIG